MAQAAVLVSQTFTGTTATGWVFGGTSYTGCLTANTGCGTDASGSGWLRLTDNNSNGNEEGYAYYNTSFASGQGFVVDFDFASWGGTGADGVLMFLQDASVTFSPGAVGGSFSYAGDCTGTTHPAGMAGAWIGVAFDEWGNFSNPNDRCKNGGPGQTPSSVAVRGPASGNYAYVTGAQTATALSCPASNPGLSGPTPNLCTARPTTGTNFRHARVILLYSGGTWNGSAYVQFGSSATLTQILSTSTWATTAPTNLRIGFAASTGGYTDYHEIRNLVITNPVDNSIVKTSSMSNVPHNSSFSYSLAVSNGNYSASTGTVVTDSLPTTYVTYVSYSVSGALLTTNGGGTTTCSYTSPTLTCTVGTLPAGSTGTITVNVTASGTGTIAGQSFSNTATVSQTDVDINTANNTSTASATLYAIPTLSIVKASTVYSDPVHNTSFAKSIPGAIEAYSITVSNSGPGQADSGTLIITDAIPTNTIMYVGDIGTTGSGPVQFTNGTPSSTMTYTYTSLSSTTDNLDFSNNNGSTWTYTPTPDSNGFDSNVTNIRIKPQGTMAAPSGSGNPSFSVAFRVKIN